MTVFQVVHKQLLLLQEVRNIFYYETTVGDPTPAEWQDIIDEIRADFVSELQTLHTNDWRFYGGEYREVSTSGLLSHILVPTSGDVIGSSATDSVPTQIALLVSVKGDTVKPNRARSYLAGWTETQVVNGLWTSPAQAAAETFIDLQAVLNAGGTNPIQRVAAQWNSSHTMVIAQNWISTSFGVASQVPATQRRRRIGVGI